MLRAVLPCHSRLSRSGPWGADPTCVIWLSVLAGTQTCCPTQCSGAGLGKMFHCCNFSRANMERNEKHGLCLPLGVCTQEESTPCLRQVKPLARVLNPISFNSYAPATPSLTSSVSPLDEDEIFSRFCCGAAAAKVPVLQGGHFQG